MKMTALPMSAKCVKYLLFLFNLLFVITGIIILSVGATVHAVYNDFQHLLDEGFLSTSAFMVAIGLIIFIIAFFGCCGAVKENFCMVITFSTLLIMVFIFEFSAGISGYVLKDKTEELIESSLFKKMRAYNQNAEDTKVIDILQTQFACCGVENYTDWNMVLNSTIIEGNFTSKLPLSCCGPQYGAINQVNCTEHTPTFYATPCLQAFGGFVQNHALTLGGVAMGLAIIQLMGIIFSCYLSRAIKRNYESV